MPEQNKRSRQSTNIRNVITRMQDNMRDLYKSTYYADASNRKQLLDIRDGINASIKDIIVGNADNIGAPNISKLYERVFMNQQSGSTTVSEFEKVFADNEFINDLANSYMDTRWIAAIDSEIDQVIKYMPKLQEAINTIRDNILSADSFSKDFLNLETDIPGVVDNEQFSRNIEAIKKKYNLNELINDTYDETSKYGERFIYRVPYTKAIQRLMDRKYALGKVYVKSNLNENTVYLQEGGEIQNVTGVENFTFGDDQPEININIYFNSGIIESVVNTEYSARTTKQRVSEQSLFEQFMHEAEISIDSGDKATFVNSFDHDIEMNKKLPTHHNFDQTLSDSLELPEEYQPSTDGLVLDKSNPAGKIKEMNGCIVKELERDKVLPIILNDICMGYYFWEVDPLQGVFEERFETTGVTNTITGLRSNGRAEAFDSMQRRENMLRNIAASIADKLDAKFINTNQDLKKEIYYILKYNDSLNASSVGTSNIRVTYIPPEDIEHFYFKLDKKTGRGISDLYLSLIPAKLWVAIYITNCLAVMTRGNDKRVYYVRQTVESNISKTLLKTINEIKKSNFGIRQVENINSVLNVTGRFNDLIIPRGADGQSPIEFEVMQGQQIEIKTDLLNLLEEAAINPLNIPIEILQTRMQQVDYALQLTMSNSKFLRFAYSRQARMQELLESFITNIYNMEYRTNIRIKVTLPPPLFVNITNTNQLIVNINDYSENIANIILADSTDDAIRAKFVKNYKIYNLGSYLNMDVIKKILTQSEQEVIADEIKSSADQQEE